MMVTMLCGNCVEEGTAVTTTMQQQQQEEVPFPYWSVWKAASALESDGLTTTLPNSCYDETIAQVVAIFREWGFKWAGQTEWLSLLNKNSLQHEAEECIIALYHLHEWLLTRQNKSEQLTVVDVCCGKGLFSMLLSYMTTVYWNDQVNITRIVMLDKMTSQQCRWNHVHAANKTANIESRPTIELWEGCNLHDYDQVLDKLYGLDSTLALVGIHLCKTLGPSFIGLANGLGPKRCPYLCLAPCCMPRLVTTDKAASRCIPINMYETQQDRAARLDAMRRRSVAMRRGRAHGVCYVCQQQHRVRDCPMLPRDKDERIAKIQEAITNSPCWKCGQVGHQMVDCKSTLNRPPKVDPPCMTMDVQGLLESPKPFDLYCQLIADTVQDCSNRQILETGLTNDSTPHQESNWNASRKSIYIVASRQ